MVQTKMVTSLSIPMGQELGNVKPRAFRKKHLCNLNDKKVAEFRHLIITKLTTKLQAK